MARRYFSSTFTATTLTSGVGAADVTLSVAAVSGAPASVPWTGVMDRGNASEELVTVTNVSGTSLTVTRATDGQTAKAHSAGATFEHVVSARDFDEANAHVNDTTTDVHPQYVTAAEGNAAYVRQAGGDTITASGAAVVPLVVKGASGQTGNLLEARNNAGTATAAIGSDGRVTAPLLILGPAPGAAFRAFLGTDDGQSAGLVVFSNATTTRAFVVRGAASQSANLAEFQNSAGTVLAAVTKDGILEAETAHFTNDYNANQPVLIARGIAGQVANLFEARNSAGTVLASVDSFGDYSTSQVVQAGQELAGGFIGGTLSSRARSAGERAIVARGAASQSANLFEAQNSAGTVLASVSAAGQLGQTDGGTFRTFVLGDPNSAGAGFRTVRVVN